MAGLTADDITFDDDPNDPSTPPEFRLVPLVPPEGDTHHAMPDGMVYTTPIEGSKDDQHIWVHQHHVPYLLTAKPLGAGWRRTKKHVDAGVLPAMRAVDAGAPAAIFPEQRTPRKRDRATPDTQTVVAERT